MYDYDIWYKGMIIGNLRADTDRKALNMARKMYINNGEGITVTRC